MPHEISQVEKCKRCDGTGYIRTVNDFIQNTQSQCPLCNTKIPQEHLYKSYSKYADFDPF